jgi:hypothetical protein
MEKEAAKMMLSPRKMMPSGTAIVHVRFQRQAHKSILALIRSSYSY